MASTNWPTGSPKAVDDNQFEILGAAWSGDGVVGVPTDTSVVYADATGRQVKVRAGKYALVHGHGWYSGTTDIIKSITANTSGNPRIDLVVLGIDRSTWALTEYVKTGTPASSPVAPSLQRDAAGTGTGKWEIPLATVAVANNAATISAADVTPVAAYLGHPQTLYVADVATLQQIPGPVAGQLAWVNSVDLLYVYKASVGWRRADWNSAWGIIGGKEYTGNGGAFGIGITTINVLNMDSGSIGLTVGRRYRVRLRLRYTVASTGNAAVFQVQETNTSGAVRAILVTPSLSSGVSYESTFAGEWNETVGGSRTFVGTGYTIGGSMSVYRTTTDNERAYVAVEDIGPSGILSYPN